MEKLIQVLEWLNYNYAIVNLFSILNIIFCRGKLFSTVTFCNLIKPLDFTASYEFNSWKRDSI